MSTLDPLAYTSIAALFVSLTLTQIRTCLRPTTKNFVTVPLPNATANRSIAGINLAFDPSKSTDYKIEIFSSETKAWTLCGNPSEAPHYKDFEHGVFLNGAIQWLSPRCFPLF
ncbi:hypothetical protein CRYUN_Cryun11dG0014400 [Craigia yunnanensis]